MIDKENIEIIIIEVMKEDMKEVMKEVMNVLNDDACKET